ncbi:MAG: hypothetical protein IJF83_03130 [Methanobrevibacter sp.]|nr:hypothetical protein [Methanobrevibacter sp.]
MMSSRQQLLDYYRYCKCSSNILKLIKLYNLNYNVVEQQAFFRIQEESHNIKED